MDGLADKYISSTYNVIGSVLRGKKGEKQSF